MPSSLKGMKAYLLAVTKKRQIKGMFDPGSKVSYILTSIVKELQLYIRTVHNLHVGHFGIADTMLIETY